VWQEVREQLGVSSYVFVVAVVFSDQVRIPADDGADEGAG
jgi:hypothetical protein